MGLTDSLGKFFGGGQGGSEKQPGPFPWQPMREGPQSVFGKPGGLGAGPDLQVVFKDSATCGLSRMMRARFENNWPADAATYYLVDVRRDRGVSEALARHFNCRHESPQVLLIRNGELLDHASHGDIDGLAPERFTG